jgi:hypothetical protein
MVCPLGYGKMYGELTKVEKVEGLGDEAWLLWANGNGSQITYHWRRANLVGCTFIASALPANCRRSDCRWQRHRRGTQARS